MNAETQCAKCVKFACYSEHPEESPANCPMRTEKEAIGSAAEKYNEQQTREFARVASVQEFEGYITLPEGRTPRHPRVEEVVQFAKKMGYEKLGIAFCFGLRSEAGTFTEILENRGFEVVSVCCKVGAAPKESIGIAKDQKIAGPDVREAMCSPITQDEILNAEKTDFNIAVGLCVGHDSLFFRHSEAPVTVLIAKDRVFGHNPAAGLYLADSYYKKLRRKERITKRRCVMPGFDGMGPQGRGPMTGGGRGLCSSRDMGRRSFGRGVGQGIGRRLGRAFGRGQGTGRGRGLGGGRSYGSR